MSVHYHINGFTLPMRTVAAGDTVIITIIDGDGYDPPKDVFMWTGMNSRNSDEFGVVIDHRYRVLKDTTFRPSKYYRSGDIIKFENYVNDLRAVQEYRQKLLDTYEEEP